MSHLASCFYNSNKKLFKVETTNTFTDLKVLLESEATSMAQINLKPSLSIFHLHSLSMRLTFKGRLFIGSYLMIEYTSPQLCIPTNGKFAKICLDWSIDVFSRRSFPPISAELFELIALKRWFAFVRHRLEAAGYFLKRSSFCFAKTKRHSSLITSFNTEQVFCFPHVCNVWRIR